MSSYHQGTIKVSQDFWPGTRSHVRFGRIRVSDTYHDIAAVDVDEQKS